MNMISLTFFAFVAAVFSALILCRKIVTDDAKYIAVYRYILLFASYVFVLYADVRFAAVLFAMSAVTWFYTKKGLTKTGVAFALLCLGYFKYTNFFVSSFCHVKPFM